MKVIDNDGLSDEDITYAIVNITPVADAGGPYFGLVNESIEFDGSNGYAINGTIVLYKWSFGDGSYGYGEKVYHSYRFGGN